VALNGAKRLAGSLFGKAEMPDLGLGDTGKVLPLRPMMERLLSLDREAWGLYAWSREPLEGKFDREQKLQYQRKAEACGREEAGPAAAGSGIPLSGRGVGGGGRKPYWKCRTVWQNPQRPP